MSAAHAHGSRAIDSGRSRRAASIDPQLGSPEPACSVSLHSTIEAFEPADWNRLASDNAFAAHGWLLTCERCWLGDFEALYFLARLDGDIVGGSVAYALQPSPRVETLDDHLLGRLRPQASRLGIRFLPALVVGPIQGYGWHIGLDQALDESNRDRVRRALLTAIEAEADRRCLNLSFTQVLGEEVALRALLAERGYLSSRNVPVAVMPVPWRTIDQYFDHLPARRRREYRRERRRNQEAGVRVECLTDGGTMDARLWSLLNGRARDGGSIGRNFDSALLRELRANMGRGVLKFVARKADTISGALLVLRQGATAIAYAVGVDPARSRADFTYFELVYYALIEYAVAHGITTIYFGRGTYPVKVRRGCLLLDAATYSRINGPWRMLHAVWYRFAGWWNRSKLPAGVRHGFNP